MLFAYIYVIIVSVVTSEQRLAPPYDIRIDHYKVATTSDLVISTSRPRFSWKLPSSIERNIQQTAYQIQIESDQDRWDSGRVNSSQSIHVPCTNPNDLQSLTHYRVRFRLWTTTTLEFASSWTSWIRFRTSIFDLHQYLMRRNDDIHWIGSNKIYMNELRKEFNVSYNSSIRSATVFMSGIGYYELYVNGDTVDPSRKLDPGWTTYEKRTLFVSYDLTTKIKSGMNALGVKLGNGWYSQEQYVPPSIREPNYGRNIRIHQRRLVLV
jgi:alpha-L-rhamnosidase